MTSYRDMTFCSAKCATPDCPRQFTDEEQAKAERWWGKPGAPVAFANFSRGCGLYLPALAPTNPQEPADE